MGRRIGGSLCPRRWQDTESAGRAASAGFVGGTWARGSDSSSHFPASFASGIAVFGTKATREEVVVGASLLLTSKSRLELPRLNRNTYP